METRIFYDNIGAAGDLLCAFRWPIRLYCPRFTIGTCVAKCKYVYRWYPAECEEKTGQTFTAVIATFVVVSSHPLLGRVQ